MTSKHTPGPWRVDDYSTDEPPRFFVVPSDYCGTVCSIDPRAARATENARLIAAAPELLEALEALVGYSALFDREYLSRCLNEKLDAGRAAIAKAKGEG